MTVQLKKKKYKDLQISHLLSYFKKGHIEKFYNFIILKHNKENRINSTPSVLYT